MRSHWLRPGYWRWWWQEAVRDHTKRGLIGMLAIGFAIAGYLSADQLVGTQEATTFTTQRVITVVRTTTGPALTTTGPALTTTTAEPGETDLVTVRQDRTVVVREPGETVTKAVTVRGPVQERVVTDRRVDEVVRTETVDRLRNVTRPGRTETVTREVTQPARTVTETLTREVPVTKEVTVTDKTTVTNVVTVTNPVTVTEQVTVTVTVKK